uniref:Aminodeoxychorismate lyase n=1 Tax=Talaromyces marneffei PM1 TaxID=1077442 RepID=A0A093VIM9_TALMA
MASHPANQSDDAAAATTFSLISSLRFDPNLPSIASIYAQESYPEPHDSPYYLLRFHQDRLLEAATHFRWPKAVAFLQQPQDKFVEALDAFIPDHSKAWRLRIMVDAEGKCEVEVHPATAWPLRCMFLPTSFGELESLGGSFPWRLVIDTTSTEPSQFTTYKTTSRDHYNAARKRVGITSRTDPVEVLLFNPEGEVMEGSITCVYFRTRPHYQPHHRHHHRRRNQEEGKIWAEWVTPPLSSGGMVSVTRQYALYHGFCAEQVIRVDELVDGERCLISNGVRGFMPAILELGASQ